MRLSELALHFFDRRPRDPEDTYAALASSWAELRHLCGPLVAWLLDAVPSGEVDPTAVAVACHWCAHHHAPRFALAVRLPGLVRRHGAWLAAVFLDTRLESTALDAALAAPSWPTEKRCRPLCLAMARRLAARGGLGMLPVPWTSSALLRAYRVRRVARTKVVAPPERGPPVLSSGSGTSVELAATRPATPAMRAVVDALSSGPGDAHVVVSDVPVPVVAGVLWDVGSRARFGPTRAGLRGFSATWLGLFRRHGFWRDSATPEGLDRLLVLELQPS